MICVWYGLSVPHAFLNYFVILDADFTLANHLTVL
jgi:hypothetical protein